MLKGSSPQRRSLISASRDPPGPSRTLLRPLNHHLAPLVAGWLALVATALWLRPLWPIDETRYVSVAWEMWLRGDFLVPYLNGAPYSHKPPLLFWLMQAGWALFGMNEWWPRAVAPLFALASLFLTALLGQRIWPRRTESGSTAAWIVFGSLLFSAFATLTLFDLLLTTFVLLGVHGLVRASQGQVSRGFVQFGAAVGLGVLAKGPVTLLHLLPVALLAPWWMAHPRPALARWYAGVAAAVVFGAGIALAWALPAAFAGGPDYRRAIFWGQTVGRIAQSFAHRHPWWWYLPMLPVMLLPWFVWPPLWRALGRLRAAPPDPGVRLLLAWTVPVFIGFSLISGKQLHYMLPLVPGFALLAAHALHATPDAPQRHDMLPPALALIAAGIAWAGAALAPQRFGLPDWATQLSPLPGIMVALLGPALIAFARAHLAPRVRMLAAAGPAVVLACHVGVILHMRPAHDLHPIGDHLRALQQSGVPLAHVGRYHGEFHFVGRLTRAIQVLEPEQVQRWAEDNPRGRVISYGQDPVDNPKQRNAAVSFPARWEPRGEPEFTQAYRRKRVFIWGPEAVRTGEWIGN
jgi:4-amino-4-deoxy-L-arabinose transferase-like glycosyltransferase